MTSFRSLRNSDLPELLSVFRQHHEAYGVMADVSLAQFEQAILARNFFDPAQLLVAVDDDANGNQSLLGWCHIGLNSDTDDTGTNDTVPSVSIAAICLANQCEASAAVQLVDEAIRIAGDWLGPGSDPTCFAGLFRDDRFGYAGLTPYSFGYGIENMDVRLHGVLQACGFVADRSIVRLVASTDGYRPAFSREAMQFRRSAVVEQKRVLPSVIRRAAALSHLDLERHALVDGSGSVIGGIDFLFSDAEAEVMSPSLAMIDLNLGEEETLSATDSYLISAVAGTLADRGIRQVEAVVDASEVSLINQMGKISFTVAGEGTVWKRRSGS